MSLKPASPFTPRRGSGEAGGRNDKGTGVWRMDGARQRALTIYSTGNRFGDSCSMLKPASAKRSGIVSSSSKLAASSPMAGDVWMPKPPCPLAKRTRQPSDRSRRPGRGRRKGAQACPTARRSGSPDGGGLFNPVHGPRNAKLVGPCIAWRTFCLIGRGQEKACRIRLHVEVFVDLLHFRHVPSRHDREGQL